MNKKILLLFLSMCIILSTCISEYTPSGVTELTGLLVVEGTICEGEVEVKLSRTVSLESSFEGQNYVENATVYIECNDGNLTGPAYHQGNGIYKLQNGILDAEKQYRLRVEVDREEIVSEFLSPLITPEIDEISWQRSNEGNIQIYVSAADERNQSNYYRWIYNETWEVRAYYYANAGEILVNGVRQRIEYDVTTPNNIYYCWGIDNSNSFLLGSSDRLAENVIKNKVIKEYEPTADQLSVLYRIDVDQILIRKEAYDYYSNLQKNIESTGGIFSSMPSEMKGNLRNINKADEFVIGFVEVATKTSKRREIPSNEGAYQAPFIYCQSGSWEYFRDRGENPYDLGYVLYYYLETPRGVTQLYTSQACADCRSKYKANKENRPDDWPLPYY